MLVNSKMENLWFAGRCASSDIKVNGAIRDQPACYMMGQAAGTAASLCIDESCAAASVDAVKLAEALRQAGAYIPQTTESL
jgi:hypothetical protein